MTLSRMVHNHGLQLKEDLREYFVPFVASDTSSAGNLIEPWRQVATKEAVPYFIKRLPFETRAWTQWQAAASLIIRENGWWSRMTRPGVEITPARSP